MELTEREKAIIQHRLDVPDAIIDAMTDCDDPPFNEDELGIAIRRVEVRVRDDLWDNLGQFPADCAVVNDCLNGSTWIACCEAEYERHNNYHMLVGREIAIIERLAEKMSKLVGYTIRPATS